MGASQKTPPATLWNPQLLTNLPRQPIVDLRMPRNRNLGPIRRIPIDAVPAALSREHTTVFSQVRQQLVPLHRLPVPA